MKELLHLDKLPSNENALAEQLLICENFQVNSSPSLFKKSTVANNAISHLFALIMPHLEHETTADDPSKVILF